MTVSPDYPALCALDAVVTHGGFLKAASALHVTQSAISQRVKTLEERFGAPLIVRSNPPVATALGRKLIAHLHSVKLLESELAGHEGKETEASAPTLVIGVNADSLATWFLDAITPLLKENRVRIELLVENEHLTHSLLQRGEVFGCISSNLKPPTGCDSVKLGSMRYICVAHPSFKKRFFKRGFSEGAAKIAPAVFFDREDWLHGRFLEGVMKWNVTHPKHFVPSSEGFVEMITRGLAYGIPPRWQVKEELVGGTLVDLAPGKGIDVTLSWQYLRRETASQRALRLVLIREAKRLLA